MLNKQINEDHPIDKYQIAIFSVPLSSSCNRRSSVILCGNKEDTLSVSQIHAFFLCCCCPSQPRIALDWIPLSSPLLMGGSFNFPLPLPLLPVGKSVWFVCSTTYNNEGSSEDNRSNYVNQTAHTLSSVSKYSYTRVLFADKYTSSGSVDPTSVSDNVSAGSTKPISRL
ncbi:MAG: hypothetical protein JOS17DRAFT_446255 [Linnemannia elongata]|nr:MAG: hypothetical protein JOS17DRAFT_446255 [Linnemannia elongata]